MVLYSFWIQAFFEHQLAMGVPLPNRQCLLWIGLHTADKMRICLVELLHLVTRARGGSYFGHLSVRLDDSRCINIYIYVYAGDEHP